MQDFTCNGVWWLPGTPSEKVAGTLRFTAKDGAELMLSGVLTEPSTELSKTVSIIQGAVWDAPHGFGEDVTLKDSWAKSVRFGSIGLTREDYHVGRIFFGSLFESPDAFVFSKARLSYSGMSSWAATYSGFTSGNFEIRWAKPEPISGAIPHADAFLGIGAQGKMSKRERSIKENVGLALTFHEPQTFDLVNRRYVFPLQSFFTLATDHNNALTELILYRPESRSEIRVFGQRVFADEKGAEDLLPHDMIFSLADVRERAIHLLSRWIDVFERFRPVCEPYFGTLSQTAIFVDVTYVMLFQALDTYERTSRGTSESGTRPGVGRREQIRRLVHEHWLALEPVLVEEAEAVDHFMAIRNYVVHHEGDLGDRPHYGEHLYWWTERLKLVMKACLLSQLGFSDQEQLSFFARNRQFIHIEQLNPR